MDGETGYLVPEHDTGALTEKMCDLLGHAETWPGMGLAGRGVVEKEFNIHCLNDTLISILTTGLH